MAEETYAPTSVGSGDPGDGPDALPGFDDRLPPDTKLTASLQATSLDTGSSVLFDKWNVVVESSAPLPVHAEQILSFALETYLNVLWKDRPTDFGTRERYLDAEQLSFLRASAKYLDRRRKGTNITRLNAARDRLTAAEATLRGGFKLLIKSRQKELDEMLTVAFQESKWDWDEWRADGMKMKID